MPCEEQLKTVEETLVSETAGRTAGESWGS